jgi:peptide/nickel transport system substrate-binding protein
MTGNLLAACSDQTTRSSSSLTPTPRNQTVIVDQQTVFTVYDSFNTFILNGEEYEAGFGQVCKEYLFYYNLATGETKPWLAQSWQYNSDYTQLTIKLNPKAHWNDGVPFTSKDVQFTIELLINHPEFNGNAAFAPIVKQVTASDDQTVVFALKTSDPRFHYNFVCGIISAKLIVPQHIWSKQDPAKFKNNPPVLTGPYKLDRTIPAQQMYIWKKDPNYWNKDVMDPKPEYVVFRVAPIADSEVDQFKRGQIDVGSNSFDYTHAIAMKNSGYQNIVTTTKFRDPCPRAFFINCDPSKGLLFDPKMHWAISYLVDRKLLATTVSNVPTVPAQFPWADYDSNAKWSNQELAAKYPLTYDPQKAAALLDELGAKKGSNGIRIYNGQPLQYEIITSIPAGQPEYINGQKLAEELTKVGVPTTLRYYGDSVFSQKFHYGEFDIAVAPVCGNAFDPTGVYYQLEIQNTKPIGQNAWLLGNTSHAMYTDLDSIATRLDHVDPNNPSNMPLFNQALEDFYKYLPLIPIYQQTYPYVFNTTYWTGWPTNDNLYQVPTPWWGQFLFVIGNLKPTGAS